MEALYLMIESHPVQNSNSLMELETKIEQLREGQPMIDDDSIDVRDYYFGCTEGAGSSCGGAISD